MHIPQRRRPEFDEARIYEYPEHLKTSLGGMPSAPGVYIFYAQDERMPFYIGKSVNLRSRVLSHLRNPDEARMLRQTVRIDHIRTAGEIGALLLEAQMIKRYQPLYNQKLRRNRQLCSLRLKDGQPEVVYSRDMDFATEPNLYGLFGSQRSALETLRELADMHMLCHSVLGLERLNKGRACFRRMLHRCAGACCGAEPLQQHAERLQAALELLRVNTWPYPGSVAIIEQGEDMRQLHVVRNWCYLGSATTTEEARTLGAVAADFDADGYKVLCGPMLRCQAEIVLL
jgi:excinuclease Cho